MGEFEIVNSRAGEAIVVAGDAVSGPPASGHTMIGGRRRRLVLCALAISCVSAVVGGVTYSAFSATTSNSANSFTAATSFCLDRTPKYLSGFESGAVSAVGSGLFDEVHTVGGTPVAQSTVKRNGDYSLRIAKNNAGASYVLQDLGGTSGVERLAVRFATLPTADLDRFMGMGIAAGNSFRVGYIASTNKLEVHFANGPKVAASSTVTAGAWHVIELNVNVGANPRTADWRIDGVAQTGTSSAEAASTFASVHWGSVNPSDVFTADYDDVLVSQTPADYPLGDGKVLALRPNSSTGPSVFSNDDATAVNATSHTRLDDNPIDSTADHVYQNAISGTSYVELGFENTTETCFNGVSAVMAHHSASSAQATNAKTSVLDGSTESVVYSANMVSTALAYRSAIATPAGQWTTSAVNGLVARFGYTTAGEVVPRWDALLVEYDVRP
jgi:predicted ribosomally synthesized peptide with SipW-like signal peptide